MKPPARAVRNHSRSRRRRGCPGHTPQRPGELAPGRPACRIVVTNVTTIRRAGGRTSRYDWAATASLPWGPCHRHLPPLTPEAEAFPDRAAGDRSWAGRRGMRWNTGQNSRVKVSGVTPATKPGPAARRRLRVNQLPHARRIGRSPGSQGEPLDCARLTAPIASAFQSGQPAGRLRGDEPLRPDTTARQPDGRRDQEIWARLDRPQNGRRPRADIGFLVVDCR